MDPCWVCETQSFPSVNCHFSSAAALALLFLLLPQLQSTEIYDGYDLPGYGREIAFVGPDPETSGELARILAKHYGFRTLVFADTVRPEDLAAVHLLVVRGSQQSEAVALYLRSGRPVLQLGMNSELPFNARPGEVSSYQVKEGRRGAAFALNEADGFEEPKARQRFVAAAFELLGVDSAKGTSLVDLVPADLSLAPDDPYLDSPPELPYFDVNGGRERYAFADEPVNRFRLYDFYRRQALHHLNAEQPAPAILPEFPALDGGAFGHWGRFHKNAFRDQRWNWMDNGDVVSAIFRADKSPAKARTVSFRLGDLSCAFDTETLRLSHVWDGGFLRFIPNRWGIGGGSYHDGAVRLSTPNTAGWTKTSEFGKSVTGRFLGYYQHGERGVLSYEVEGVRILDLPGSVGDVFTRTIEFQDATEQLFLQVGEATKVLRIEDSGMRGVVREILPGVVEFHKTLPGDTATLYLSHEKASFPESHKEPVPSSLIEGGPSRWSWEFTTAGELGEAEGGFAIDRIPVPLLNPYGSPMLIGGHDFLANGDAAVTTMMGDVWIVSGLDDTLEQVTWRRFATGLNQALGLEVIEDKIYVIGRDRITRLHDLNQDGEADFYENFSQGVPASTGGHDFTVGLQADDAGNFYTVAAGSVVRIAPDGTTDVIATGFRNANGIGVSGDGIVLASTNEGDWTPASAVMEIQEGDFYGRRAKPDQTIAPPLCFLPRGIDNSSGGQVFVEGEAWSPLQGAIVHTSFGYGTWGLILRDDSGPRAQGAYVPMRGDFNSGAHRARFNPADGQLYLTGADGWGNYAMDDGSFDRIRLTDESANVPVAWKAHANGLHITMSDPIDLDSVRIGETFVQQWNYEYSPGYGSREYSVKQPYSNGHDPVPVTSVQVLDERTLFFEMPEMVPVMQMHLVSRFRDAEGDPVLLELFPTILSLAEPVSFDGMQPVAPDKASQLALRVRHPKAGEGAKIPKGGQAGRTIEIDMIAGLRFSQTEVRAQPKERLTFVITNKDPMPHNLVLIEPGSFEAVGAASNALLTDPHAFEKHYVPEMDEVIWHTPLMEHNAWRNLKFNVNAPEEPGEYPYLCTFPGHWMIMKGVLIVE